MNKINRLSPTKLIRQARRALLAEKAMPVNIVPNAVR